MNAKLAKLIRKASQVSPNFKEGQLKEFYETLKTRDEKDNFKAMIQTLVDNKKELQS